MSAAGREAGGPAPAGAAKDRFHVPSLDGIRALSFLLVFAAHSGLDRVVPGGFGVTVFFFLSGYLITTLLRIEHDARGKVSLSQFYLGRALRILPPFYLVLGIAALGAKIGLVPFGVEARALAAQALHVANYWIIRHGYEGLPVGTGVYWSLAVEEHFYVVFPFLYLLLRRSCQTGRRQALVLWALCAAVLAWRCVLVFWLHAEPDRTYVGSDTRVDSILFGCALALAANPKLDGPSRIPEKAWKWLLFPAGALVLLFSFVYRGPGFRETFRYSLQGVALYPVFIVAVRYPSFGPFRLLNHRALTWFGALTYPAYLVHHVLLAALGPLTAGGGVLRALVALTLTIAAAWTIHELVEKPCARLRRVISGGGPKQGRDAEPAGAPSLVRASKP